MFNYPMNGTVRSMLLANKQVWEPVIDPIIDFCINACLNTYYAPTAFIGNNPFDQMKNFWTTICKP